MRRDIICIRGGENINTLCYCTDITNTYVRICKKIQKKNNDRGEWHSEQVF